jgi:hypothetical protein
MSGSGHQRSADPAARARIIHESASRLTGYTDGEYSGLVGLHL